MRPKMAKQQLILAKSFVSKLTFLSIFEHMLPDTKYYSKLVSWKGWEFPHFWVFCSFHDVTLKLEVLPRYCMPR